MKKIYFVFFAMAVVSVSCHKDFGGDGTEEVNSVTIPADFDWATTRDVTVTVEAPDVDGTTPAYAVVRIYSSPVLNDASLVAKGVTTAATPFRTSLTVPAGTENVYVRTTLPDGSSSVEAVAANGMVNVSGASMKSLASEMPKIRIAATRTSETSMPDYPVMTVKSESDFTKDVVIGQTPASMYDLGAEYMKYSGGIAASEYYIPAGVEITGNINLNGGQSPFRDPVLYVAGKLTMESLHIGSARLAVLPGGVVTIKSLTANNEGSADKPAIYVFEGGEIAVDKINFSGKSIVNCGKFAVKDEIDANNEAKIYNVQTAGFSAEEMKCSNSVEVYNDGNFTIADGLKLNSGAHFYNCENADLRVNECDLENGGNEFFQRGKASFKDLDVANGKFYVNCYTYVTELDGENAKIFLSAGACLECREAEFNNTHIDLAAGSLFITQEYEDDDNHGNVKFDGSGDERAVIRIEKKLDVEKTVFSGELEVVFPEGTRISHFKKLLKAPAFATLEQSTNIPATECNDGKGQITPEPEPEPGEYELIPGTSYTYCFEDTWPWLGDYDMNDAVVVCSIDRNQSKDGGKVASIDINWELKAAGTTRTIAFAVQMEQVATAEVASVESTCKTFGSGIFASQQPEQGNELAVIPFFNDTKDLLASSNTWQGHTPAMTTKYTTRVTFAQPVASEKVRESVMNFFIAVNNRSQEIHMPIFQPTKFGVVGTGCFLPDAPYKFFVKEGENHSENNYMMWALQIPGDFRYPAETKDIRSVYKYFNEWAASNGVSHREWYEEESDAAKIF